MSDPGPRTDGYPWHCPQCGQVVRFPNLRALCLAERAGGCQGCRARATLEREPGLIGLFMDFWDRADAWPQSSSWTEAIDFSDSAGPGGRRVDRQSKVKRTCT